MKIKNKIKLLSASVALSLASGTLAAKTFDPDLLSLLSAADEATLHQVIITFDQDGAPSADQLSALTALGIDGVSMHSLPIVGALATKAQIEAIYGRDDVRSVWENEKLSYENFAATQLTGVHQLRADKSMRIGGIPYSGRGIGVVVNDSGIDGNHNDVKYPHHVVQNVIAQTNIKKYSSLTPVTYLENQINSDLGSGHGTHVAGTIGGNGAMSSGMHAGVAPGADLIGYGSGAGISILDSLGGFDYALTHQFDYNIRVVSNSFGSTSDVGTDFEPDHPTNVATKKLADRGMVVVFSAGNSGSGASTITGNFKKAPWIVTVAAGDKDGNLANFSSRGTPNKGGTVVIDGETFTWEDRPTITAPGVDIISARASTSDDADVLEPASLTPFYAMASGTSMAAPHVSGIVALMLEANPDLHWSEVKQILQDTATNMSGRTTWEAGAGYVNAHAAVKAAEQMAGRFGDTVKQNRKFNAQAINEIGDSITLGVDFIPAGDVEVEGVHEPVKTFEVGPESSLVFAGARMNYATAFVLEDPAGNQFASGIGLPLLGPYKGVVAPAMAGTWKVFGRGITSLSGNRLDPLGVTNGISGPTHIEVTIEPMNTIGFKGLDDVQGHPAQGFAEFVVSRQLMDGLANGFMPDAPVTKADLADSLALSGALRQSTKGNLPVFSDSDEVNAAAINAAVQKGAALKDRAFAAEGVIPAESEDNFGSDHHVSREALAYSLVQTLGKSGAAQDVDPNKPLQVFVFDQWVDIADSMDIAPELRGHVQTALDMGLMQAKLSLSQGPYDPEPVLSAHFNPTDVVTRAKLAMSLSQLYYDMGQ